MPRGLTQLLDSREREREPEGGWRPTCRVEDHRWKVRCEAGSVYLECLDPHSEEELNLMRPDGTNPGCIVGAENLLVEFGPLTLRWETDCPRRGYNDSGSHGHGCDCDYWLTVVENTVVSE